MISRLLGYLVTFLLLVLLFEGVLRLAGCSPQPPVVEYNAQYGWSKTPSKTTKRSFPEFTVETVVNSKGLRGPETEYASKPGVKRVLFVGDSFVQGYAVAEKDLFVSELAKELGANVEVLNGGTEGWSTDQEFLWFQNEGLKYKPDVVVLCAYDNDVFWCARDYYTDRAKPRFELGANGHLTLKRDHVSEPAPTPWWKDHTAIGNSVKNVQKGLLASSRDVLATDSDRMFGEVAVVLRQPPAEITQAWGVVDALLNEFAKLAKGNGATPVLLSIPSKSEIHGDAMMTGGKSKPELKADDPSVDFSLPKHRYAELAKAAGFLVVDPTAALKAEAAKGDRLYFSKDFHWNADGNRVVADVLETELQKAGLTPPAVAHEGIVAAPHGSTIPTWAFVVASLWLLLGTAYWRSYPEEHAATGYLKVGGLILVMAGIFLGIGKLTMSLPPAIGGWVMRGIFVALIIFIIAKVSKRIGVIGELYGTFLRRGHWYMLPLLVVMLAIGMLLVVAASSPFVAPFIYTLF